MQATKTHKIDQDKLNDAWYKVRAINHPTRRAIIKLLENCKDPSVNHIKRVLRIEQSVCSQQLAIMRRAGFVVGVRRGKEVLYRINAEELYRVNKSISNFLNSKS